MARRKKAKRTLTPEQKARILAAATGEMARKYDASTPADYVADEQRHHAESQAEDWGDYSHIYG